MKRIKLLMCITVLSFFLTGCDRNFSEINKNPNTPQTVPSSYIMTYAVRNLGFTMFSPDYNGEIAWVACQQWAHKAYTNSDRYSFYANMNNTLFRFLYIIQTSFDDIIRLNTDPDTKNQMLAYGDNAAQIGSAMIMKVWATEMCLEMFGDIPYSQALQSHDYPSPVYDTQEEVFAGLLKDAEEAVAILKTSTMGWKEGDVVFFGDTDKWIKFGNALRLRLIVRLSNIDSSYKTKALSVLSDNMMTSNADNAVLKFIKPGTPNQSPMYDYFIYVNDVCLSQQFVDLMLGRSDSKIGFVNPFEGVTDPRFNEFIGAVNVSQGNNTGIPYGMTNAETTMYVNTHGDNLINLFTTPPPRFVQADSWITFIDYPSVCFFECEARDWDAACFEEGLRASLELWDIEDNVDTFVSSVMDRFRAASSDEKKREIVMTQKYIHLFTQPWEAWAEARRSGYPLSLLKPGDVTFIDGETPVYFSPDNYEENRIVQRMTYASTEYTLNGKNVSDAAKRMGGDSYSTKLIWAK